VLRRVNLELPDEAHRRYVYSEVVKRSFGARVLGSQERRRILVPPKFRTWCDDVTERQVAALGSAGYHVVGSLEDLCCRESSFGAGNVQATEREVAAAAVSALATMLARRGLAVAEQRTGRIRVDKGWRGLIRRLVA
jgi:hypothetical protein